MTIPVVAEISTPSLADTTDNIDINYPSTISAGDVLICYVASDQSTATQQWDGATYFPSGFTFINESGSADSDCHCAAFYKVATGSETGTENVTSAGTANGIIGFMVRLTDVDTADLLNVVGADYNSTADDTDHVIGGATTDEADCLAFVVYALDGGNGQPFSLSGSWTQQEDHTSTLSDFSEVSGGLGTLGVASAGAYGDVTVTSSQSNGMTGFTFAIKGTASAGGASPSPIFQNYYQHLLAGNS